MSFRLLLGGFGAGVTALALATLAGLAPTPDRLPPNGAALTEPRYLDRHGEWLSVTYQNAWNVHDRIALHEAPPLLVDAFLTAEDKRFYEHGGVDWIARLHAVVQNVAALRPVRGASTITEQVVRMLHPRPRTVWSRWVEGFEAARLEARFEKAQILELYLNQVPYARNRRGVVQAAREYFDRDLDTLTPKETLALAALVRSPSRMDLHRGTVEVEPPIERLAVRLHQAGGLSDRELERVLTEPLEVREPALDVDAAHFVAAAGRDSARTPVVRTTLDGSLQRRAQQILDRQIAHLASHQVTDGALLVVDHTRDEILAWVNGGGFEQEVGGQIDMVTTPRQPGSALKPFVYALAMERGWTPATVLDDAPLAEAVGNGLHSFRNYSRHYYGPVRLRDALGNSLNVPAVKAVQFTGRSDLQLRLRELGIESLSEHPDFYGDGLALGNGELSLFELVRAYTVLARGGVLRPLRFTLDAPATGESRRVFDPEVSSLVADILSDPEARALEFGRRSILALPRPTAVKTGTSNDYRDAWAVGFTDRYTVGVWMGNVDRRSMKEITGSVGPGLVLRAVFAELYRTDDAGPLFLSRKLRQAPICRESGLVPGAFCPTTMEWFRTDDVPVTHCPLHGDSERRTARGDVVVRIQQPSPGLHLALDPRIPDELERFELRLSKAPAGTSVEWFVDDAPWASSVAENGAALWTPTRGRHLTRARVQLPGDSEPRWTETIAFYVR